jgi:hypothetical protein
MGSLRLPALGEPVIPILFRHQPQVSADVAGGASVVIPMPFKGRVVGAVGEIASIGGGTPFTDIDLTIQNADNSDANMLEAVIPVVNASAIVRTAAVVLGPSDTEASRKFAKGDKIELVIDVTGGASSPVADGIAVTLFVVRDE